MNRKFGNKGLADLLIGVALVFVALGMVTTSQLVTSKRLKQKMVPFNSLTGLYTAEIAATYTFVRINVGGNSPSGTADANGYPMSINPGAPTSSLIVDKTVNWANAPTLSSRKVTQAGSAMGALIQWILSLFGNNGNSGSSSGSSSGTGSHGNGNSGSNGSSQGNAAPPPGTPLPGDQTLYMMKTGNYIPRYLPGSIHYKVGTTGGGTATDTFCGTWIFPDNSGKQSFCLYKYSPPPTATLLANGSAGPITNIAGGTSVTLSWSSTNATSCTVNSSPATSSYSGTSNAGVASAALTGGTTYTFTLSCSGLGGTASSSVVVTPQNVVKPYMTVSWQDSSDPSDWDVNRWDNTAMQSRACLWGSNGFTQNGAGRMVAVGDQQAYVTTRSDPYACCNHRITVYVNGASVGSWDSRPTSNVYHNSKIIPFPVNNGDQVTIGFQGLPNSGCGAPCTSFGNQLSTNGPVCNGGIACTPSVRYNDCYPWTTDSRIAGGAIPSYYMMRPPNPPGATLKPLPITPNSPPAVPPGQEDTVACITSQFPGGTYWTCPSSPPAPYIP